MDIVDVIQRGEPVGSSAWRVEIGGRRWLGRACRLDESGSAAGDIRLVEASGLARWRHLIGLTDDEHRYLELADGCRIIALRHWIDGTPMVEVPERAADNWQQWSLDIAYILQAIHSQKSFHGDLKPTKVIIPDDGRPRLVGLPVGPADVGPTTDRQSLFLAPEAADGDPGQPADIYGLAAMVCWMATGGDPASTTSEQGNPKMAVPESIDEPLAGLLRRSLMVEARARPSAGEFFEVMSEAVSARPYRFVGLPPNLYRGLELDVVEALREGKPAVVLEGKSGTGRTFALRRLRTRLQADGWRTVYGTPDAIRGPDPAVERETSLDRGPWEPIRRLVEALEGRDPDEAGAASADESLQEGDSLRHFRHWADRLDEALEGAAPTVVLWDDFDVSAPDLRAFFRSLFTDLADDGRADKLRLVVATASGDRWWDSATRFEVVGPDRRAWQGWRNSTHISQVRRVPEGRFSELVDQHGDRPVEFIEAINESLQVRRIPGFARRKPATRAVPDASVLFAGDWRKHLDELLDRGAHVQAVVTCRRIYDVLRRSHPRERLQVLPPWLEAVAGTGFRPDFVDELREILVETGQFSETRTDAGLLLARLYGRVGFPDRGLEVLDGLGDLDEARRIEWSRRRAAMLLAAGRLDEAGRQAADGMQLLDESGRSYRLGRLHFQLIEAAVEAAGGDGEAIDRLRRLVPRLEDEEASPRLIAGCHHWCGVGLTERGRDGEAADAYRRALETMESAGLVGQLPGYLLEVGLAQLRRGRLGLARQYLVRGTSLIHEGTTEAVRLKLWAESGDLEVTLGNVESAADIVDRTGRQIDEESPVVYQGRYCRLAGDVAAVRSDFEEAIRWYDRGLEVVEDVGRRAGLLVAKAGLAVAGAEPGEPADRLVERASRLVERHDLDEHRSWLGIVRGRLQRSSDDELDRVGGNERLELHLREAVEDDRFRLVLRQVGPIWKQLDPEGDRALRRLVAEAFDQALEAATVGLTPQMRTEIVDGLPDIPAPDRIEEEPRGARGRLEELEEDNRELRRQIERLEARLEDRDDEIEELRAQNRELEEQLEAARSGSNGSGKRGRRPKASRREVVEALEQTDYDYDETAERLGVSTRTLYRYMNKYDLRER